MMRTRRRLMQLSFLAALAPAAFAQQDATLNIATYNLRMNTASDGPNAWPHRKELVKSLVRYHDFDLLATQEGLPDQIADLDGMQEYAHVGVGRDDGKNAGEHSAIFYKRQRFTLLRNADFWLSQTPDRPSLGWDATCCHRIASWAQLQDRQTGRKFYFFSVHFDHEGEVARRESAKLMLRKVKEIAGSEPVIVAGDLNSVPETEQVGTMKSQLADAFDISAKPAYGPVGTFNGFKIDSPLNERIDYIFVSPQVKVLSYATLTDSLHGRFPSDHLPVLIKARIN
ncbi:endonuclease/exonuclease/phosphatase family protein [Duganella sp. Root1480D1]|uniref:endonuclease/exonuclease/phosphatase family protein n=1 Tax=Duganella sp. Root1480D1 TaxID=1736471 RepID=UPI00070BD5F0|nr:endonuclease/exonuclease/phosphatase family protein [Duganella sp. Root1480D1]KQZ40574.1 endonuclease [Duganella sp. Root1480D1]